MTKTAENVVQYLGVSISRIQGRRKLFKWFTWTNLPKFIIKIWHYISVRQHGVISHSI